jgi:predicted nuclease of restriction endonuclease-like (RecB) superfamily
MKFDELTHIIMNTQNLLQYRALQTVNQLLVVRNWLIGYQIVEYEQNGEDRVTYGTNALQKLAQNLQSQGVKGFSYSNLKIFRQLYQKYPQLQMPITKLLNSYFAEYENNTIRQIESGELEKLNFDFANPAKEIRQLGAGELETEPNKLLQHFAFSHFVHLLTIDEPQKRFFYEQQTIKNNWNAKQLGRQIETLYFERIGISKNKTLMIEQAPKGNFIELVEQTINDPYIFEFTGFKELEKYSENDLETALLTKIEDFLLELGHGFCFEARQKRITVEGEHDQIDLVFYHRILRCHVLIDLKIKKFRIEYVGQMLYYLNYYRENVMTPYDNPPVGIILCTDKKQTQVKYATAGLDNQIFVSKYKLQLPKEEDFIKLFSS